MKMQLFGNSDKASELAKVYGHDTQILSKL